MRQALLPGIRSRVRSALTATRDCNEGQKCKQTLGRAWDCLLKKSLIPLGGVGWSSAHREDEIYIEGP